MQKFGPKTPLQRFRRDALHRSSMCGALADDDADYLAVALAAAATVATVDGKTNEVQHADDLLVRARAVERARKIKAVTLYDQARRDLAAEAVRLVMVLLPTPPSALKKVGITRARAIIQQAVENLRLPDSPAEVREEHLPILEAHLASMAEADLAEDSVAMAFISLRAALVLFKSTLERERVGQYADLLKIVGERALAEEFFLTARTSSSVEDDEEEVPTAGDAPTETPA
jgi:prolyl oligopeptidase PreP (S9A serine peptidase family)